VLLPVVLRLRDLRRRPRVLAGTVKPAVVALPAAQAA